MKSSYFIFALVVSLAALTTQCKNKTEIEGTKKLSQGTLFIIGGGMRDSALMEKLIVVSGWKSGDWISVVSMTSRWDSAYISLNNEFRQYTRSSIRCIRIDSNTVKNPSTLDSMRKSRLIYISGGDQSLHMQHIAGTDFKEIINMAYDQGATIAGTSAGAALMSEKMLTGNQLKDSVYASAIPVIWKNNMEIIEGLGFLDSVIIDQHFIVRSRQNRLMSVLLDNRLYDAIGIDESTALIVQNDTASVIGQSQVMVYRNPRQVSTQGNNLIGAGSIELSIYLPGQKFKIKR